MCCYRALILVLLATILLNACTVEASQTIPLATPLSTKGDTTPALTPAPATTPTTLSTTTEAEEVKPALIGGEPIEVRNGLKTIEMKGAPQQMAAGEGSIWVLNAIDSVPGQQFPNAGMLMRIDPDSGGKPVLDFAALLSPFDGLGDGSMAVGEGAVWITDPTSGTLTRFGIVSGEVVVHQPLGPEVSLNLVTVGEGFIWVTYRIKSDDKQGIAQIDPHSMEVIKTIEVSIAVDVAVSKDSVWVTNGEVGTVTQIDLQSSEVVGQLIPVGKFAGGVEIGAGSIWVLDWSVGATVTQINPDSGQVVGQPIPVGPDPFDMAVGEGYVWITNRSPGSVTRLDARSGAVIGEPIKVGNSPKGLTVFAGSVWVANSGSGTVTRIIP